MKAFLAAVIFFFVSPLAQSCDRDASTKVQGMLRQMASWSEKSGKVRFDWGSDWDSADRKQRLGLITAFADSDAFLNGKAREIEFYRNGKLVGKASPSAGISLVG
jgi:hypothetical protein